LFFSSYLKSSLLLVLKKSFKKKIIALGIDGDISFSFQSFLEFNIVLEHDLYTCKLNWSRNWA